MNTSRLNTAYAVFLIVISVIVMFSYGLDLENFIQYSSLIIAGFGIVLLPVSSAIKKEKSSAKYISLVMTAFIGTISLIMLMKVQLLSRIVEPSLITTTVVSYVLTGVYLSAVNSDQKS